MVVWGCIVKAQRSGENAYRALEAAQRPAFVRFFAAELKRPSAAARGKPSMPLHCLKTVLFSLPLSAGKQRVRRFRPDPAADEASWMTASGLWQPVAAQP